ncbi:MAG: PQQ-binding-like beta-propeller repeat protein [Candidatus Eremiobacteraeota bacterium]|nr:PQQ-binding-like beta-propeller repeat protein [Candidatus Eremiobacteraeota bacterium]
MKYRQLSTAAIAFALSACGPASPAPPSPLSWTMYQNGLTHDAVVPVDFPGVKWDRKQDAKMNGGIGYDGVSLFVVTFSGDLLAVDPRTGSVRWRAHADDVLMSTPIVADGMVFVGSGTNAHLYDRPGATSWGRAKGNHWYAFRTDNGAMVWSYATIGEAMPSAAYTNGRLIFATGDDVAIALDARSGQQLWRAPLPGVATMASAMVDGNTIFFASTMGKYEWNSPTRNHTLSVDVASGRILWSVPYGNADCTPTVAQGTVFIEGANDGPMGPREAIGNNEVFALNERTGALRWRYVGPQGNYTSVGSDERAIAAAYAGGVLFQSVPSISSFVAFRASDGRILWSVRTSGPVKMSALIDGKDVYVGDTSGVLYRLDARSGAVRAALLFDRPFTPAPPLIVGKTLFVANTDYLRAVPLASF